MQISVVNWKGGCGKSTLVISLLDVMKEVLGWDVQVVEHDLQGSLARAAHLGFRHQPVELKQTTSKYIVHDFPPYNSSSLLSILDASDLILIPIKLSDQDLLAASDLVDFLKEKELLKRSVIVLNELRRPHTNLQKVLKRNVGKNFKDVRIAKVELSNLSGFRGILRKPIHGQAKEQIVQLINELGISTNKKRTIK